MESMLCRAQVARFDIHVFKVHEGEEPIDIRAYDGFLLTGSRKGVYDDDPWIGRLLTLIRRLHAAKIKTIGICFGHQAIAAALGGRVQKFAKGWGVGVQHYRLVDSSLARRNGLGDSVALPCCHQDQVIKLPPAANHILTNDFCENAGFAIGEHMLAVQPHPEFSVTYLECILRMIESRIGAPFAAAIESLKRPTDNDLIAKLIAAFYLGLDVAALADIET